MSEVLKRRQRCAVYCRVSSDERLDQSFNSIDAQKEAGHAYVASQRSEGWIPVADDYDDGGFSGGNMERPGLRRLMNDIEDGRVDIVVVYKIDRNMVDRNKRRIQAILESGQNKKFDRDIRLMAGTVLTREYQGKEYRIMATVDGQYEFDGRCYQSLSRIAKEITGTAWSGPVFFGLKSTAAKKTTGRKGAGK